MIPSPNSRRLFLHAAIAAACVLAGSAHHAAALSNEGAEPAIIPTVHPTLSPTSAIPVPLLLRADHTSVWQSDVDQRMFATGRVVIEIGYRSLRADNAAVWLTPSKESGESIFDVAIYLSGNVRVLEGDHADSTQSRADELLVTTRISRSVELTGTPISHSEEASPIVKRGEVLRQQLLNAPPLQLYIPHLVTLPEQEALQSGWIAKGPNNRIIAGPGEVQVARGPNGQPILVNPGAKPPSSNKRRPEVFATGDLITGPLHVGHEEVTIIHAGYMLVNTRDNKPQMEFHAQRIVLFSPEQAVTGGKTPVPKNASPIASQITGAYLEGDVTVEAGAQSVHATRLYYDFTSNRAIMLDATLSAYDEQRKIPVYLRAAEIRQLSRSQFAARKANFSTSEFYTPHYSIGASQLYMQDITPRDDKGKAIGLATYAYKAKADIINVRGVPVFYWPYLAGDTSKSELPLRRLKAGNSSTYGLSIETDWDIFALAGQPDPKGLRADLDIDYFSKRGPAGGVQAKWDNDDSNGLLRSYALQDNGTDDLGVDRKGIAIPDETRGRLTARHRQDLGDGWTLALEGSYISDPNFLQQYFRDEYDTDKEHETSIYLKKQGETDALTFLGKFSLFDFTATADQVDDQYSTEKKPEVKYWRIGDSFFDTLTYYSETSASNLHTDITNYTPVQLGLLPSFLGTPASFLPFDFSGTTYRDYYKAHGFTTSDVLRGDTRQELDLPLRLGDLTVTPYLAGRLTAWDTAFPEDHSGNTTRAWGQAGVRGSMAFWKVYNDVNSRFWDLHRIRHIIEPQFILFGTGSTESRDQLQQFDDDVEGISRASGASLSLNQKWQTKRGGEGHWRTVDWLVFNLHFNQFWNQDKNSFLYTLDPLRGFVFNSRPELSLVRNSVSADGVWRIGERTRFIGEANYNTDDNRLEQFSTGIVVDQTNALSYFFGNRYVRALDTDEWTVAMDYQLTRKYELIAAESYDFQLNHNILSSFTLIRKLPRFNVAITATYDANQGDTSVVFTAWPEGFPELGLGNRGGGAAQPK